MRIRDLAIENFEGIVSQHLSLGTPKKVQLIYGANEAGKSRTLRAIYSALFGFSASSVSGQSGKLASQLTMSLERPAGLSLTFVRKPGKSSKALVRATGELLTEAELGEWTQSLRKDTFMSSHGLTQKTLEDGGRQLLADKGEFGRILFGAALGTTWLTERLHSLSAHAEQLYANRATTKPLNLSLAAFDHAQKVAREQTHNPEALLEQERALAAAEAELAEMSSNLKTLARQKTHTETVLRLHKHAETWTRARRELAAQPHQGADDVALTDSDIADWCARIDTHAERGRELPRLELASRHALDEAERAAKASGIHNAAVAALPTELRMLVEKTGARIGELERVRTEAKNSLREQRALLEAVRVRQKELRETSYEPQLESLYEQGTALLQDFKHAAPQLSRVKAMKSEVSAQRTVLNLETETLSTMVLPDANVLSEHLRELRGGREEQARLSAEAHRLNDTRLDMLARKDREFSDSASSTEDALRTARMQRDAAWSEVRRAKGALDAASAEQYERFVTRADELADTLARDAAKIEAEKNFVRAMNDIERRLEQTATEQSECAVALAALEEKWTALWPPALQRRHPAPELAGQWRERVVALIRVEHEIGEFEATRSGLEDRRAAFLERVGETLTSMFGSQAPEQPEGKTRLEDVLVRIKSLRDSEHRLQTERATVDAQRTELTRAISVGTAREQELEQESAGYQETWTNTLSSLGLPGDLDADHALRLVRDLEDLARKKQTAEELAQALRTAKETFAMIEAELAELRRTLHLDEKASIKEHLLGLQGVKRQRDRLLDLAQQATRELEEGAAPEQSVEDRARDILAMDPADLRVDLAALETRYEDSEKDLRAQTQAVARLALALEVARKPGEAAQESMTEAQFHLTAIKSYAEDYVRTKIAIHAVTRAITRYREENESTVLARARQLFLHFTGGAYGRLELHHEDQQLLCVRQDGFAASVDMLSDGTRDQLYLALRLAALEELALRSEPMPLILDDVLVNFDDERTALTLDALGDFAATSQVIMFTHHRRTWDIAKKRLRGRIDLHELGKGVVPANSSTTDEDEQLALL